jgi:hypothetical protein
MKFLISSLVGLALGGCFFLERVTRPSPVEMPKESVRKEVIARFQQGKLPEPKQMFVCAQVPTPDGPNAEEFWCIDYFLFQAKLREEEAARVSGISL